MVKEKTDALEDSIHLESMAKQHSQPVILVLDCCERSKNKESSE